MTPTGDHLAQRLSEGLLTLNRAIAARRPAGVPLRALGQVRQCPLDVLHSVPADDVGRQDGREVRDLHMGRCVTQAGVGRDDGGSPAGQRSDVVGCPDRRLRRCGGLRRRRGQLPGRCCVSAAMRPVPAPASTGARMLADAKAGLRWVRRQPWLWYGLWAGGVLNFAAFSPATVLAPLLVRDILHEGAVVYGLVFAVAGVGGGVAALVVGRLGAPRQIVTVTWAAWGTGCLAVLGLSFAPDVVAVAAFLALAVAMLTVGNLLWHTMMQRLVPARIFGRASSVDWLFSLCLTPLGVLVGGVLATSIGVRETFLLGSAIAAAASFVVVSPRVREPECSGLFGREADRSSDTSQRTQLRSPQ
jgi:Transmembrane secretion effector